MRKLEEITTAEEQRIEKAEKDLEEDAVRFLFDETKYFLLAHVRSILSSE